MLSKLRSALTALLPTDLRDDYRRSRKLAQVQATYGQASHLPGSFFLHRLRLSFFPKRTLLIYPVYPISNYVIFKLCAVLGYKLVDRPGRRHDLAIHYFPTTRADPAAMRRLPKGRPVVNGRLSDTSKSRVAEVFERRFGYPLRIDPTRHVGRAVVKSEENGLHDADIVECPIAAASLREGYTYQKAVDNRTADGCYLDYRAPVHAGHMPMVYSKYHTPGRQFRREYTRIDLCAPEDAFSPEEIRLLLAFAEDFGLDYGELDVLRDNGDGRLYVVDVNNVPVGPTLGFTEAQSKQAVNALSATFERMVEAFIARGTAEARTFRAEPRPGRIPPPPLTSRLRNHGFGRPESAGRHPATAREPCRSRERAPGAALQAREPGRPRRVCSPPSPVATTARRSRAATGTPARPSPDQTAPASPGD